MKKLEVIMALMMVMGLALLIYALAERHFAASIKSKAAGLAFLGKPGGFGSRT